MNQQKQAKHDHPIHELITQRWSPYAFSDQDVSDQDLCSLFEAARWAASSYNEQPWSYIVAKKTDTEEFKQMLSCLVEANQAWAEAAPVLAIGCTRLVFERNGKPNAVAVHDLGLASANLTFEATSRGLSVHQMSGIVPEKAIELFGIPPQTIPVTALAIGYAAAPNELPAKYLERDLSPRPRKALAEFVFGSKWGTPTRI
jgi:nitroreductase